MEAQAVARDRESHTYRTRRMNALLTTTPSADAADGASQAVPALTGTQQPWSRHGNSGGRRIRPRRRRRQSKGRARGVGRAEKREIEQRGCNAVSSMGEQALISCRHRSLYRRLCLLREHPIACLSVTVANDPSPSSGQEDEQ